MTFPRASGILLYPTSLPGRFAIGDLGGEAYRFADFLIAAGQTLWQVLPLGSTGYGGSPYACYSAFAGNTLLISPAQLFENGLISKSDLDNVPTFTEGSVDFEAAQRIKESILAKACDSYQNGGGAQLRGEFKSFVKENASWLDDYALFRALKRQRNETPWCEWEPELAQRNPTALECARKKLRDKIEAEKFFQFLFFKQWSLLKTYCNQRGIKIIGDIPMFVAHDSADVWTNRDQFKLNPDGTPAVVAGVPPDYFSETGQYWGNPLFDWERMRADGFRWWIERVRATLRTVDIARIDHFRGFVACWEIPGGDKTAERGRWVETPGRKLFDAIRSELGELPIFAEDLGVITPEVEQLRDECGFPGMRVLQFAFSGDSTNIHLPHNYPRNVVVYTGTHDNDTTVGWFHGVNTGSTTRSADEIENERNYCLEYLNSDGTQINWDFIRAAFASVANTAIVPLQDALGLGSEARMNMPNTNVSNWRWRFTEGALSDSLAERLKHLAQSCERNAGSALKDASN